MRLVIALIIASYSCCAMAYIVDGSRVNQPRLLAFAKGKLQNEGIIQASADGGSHVKVADKYVQELIRQVKAQGFEVPKTGALIHFIAAEEARTLNHDLREVAELGKTVRFEPLGFYTIVKDDQEFFMLAVGAPELSLLRQKYGLSEKLANHEFHITIGIRTIKAHNELAD